MVVYIKGLVYTALNQSYLFGDDPVNLSSKGLHSSSLTR